MTFTSVRLHATSVPAQLPSELGGLVPKGRWTAMTVGRDSLMREVCDAAATSQRELRRYDLPSHFAVETAPNQNPVGAVRRRRQRSACRAAVLMQRHRTSEPLPDLA